jgi:CspA family cold shock protein
MLLHSRIDVQAELGACESIRATSEDFLDQQLREAGLEPEGLQQRLEATIPGLPGGFAIAGIAPPETAIYAPGAGHTLGLSLHTSNLFEAEGHLKFFDSQRGYGFFTMSEGSVDVMVHIKVLEAAGYRTLYEGTRIHALVQKTPKGLQTVQILGIDDTSARHPSLVPPRTKETVTAESAWVAVIVKFYDRLKGYGFVHEGPDSPDCFVHADTLRRWGMAPLRPGQQVEVRWGTTLKGRMVAEIRHSDGGGLPKVH